MHCPKAEFLDKIQAKIFRVFLVAIHSHLYSFALRFTFLQTHGTFYSFYSSVTVQCKGERRKPNRKPYPLPYGLRNPHRKRRSEKSQYYAQKPQRNCTFMNLASKLNMQVTAVMFVIWPNANVHMRGNMSITTMNV
jgi:hypothetical protein